MYTFTLTNETREQPIKLLWIVLGMQSGLLLRVPSQSHPFVPLDGYWYDRPTFLHNYLIHTYLYFTIQTTFILSIFIKMYIHSIFQ